MKRRNFIKTSLIVTGGALLFTGCGKSNEKTSGTDLNNKEIKCTGCNKCKEVCPLSINITAAFSAYNTNKETGDKSAFINNYESLNENERPDKCIKCGICASNCGSNLNIPELLAKISDEYKSIKA